MVRSFFFAVCVCWLNFAGNAVADAAPHFDILADIDPIAGTLSVDMTATVEGRDKFVYRLASWMSVDLVTVNGHRLETHDAEGVPLPDSGRHQVGFRLTGAPPPMPEVPSRGFRGVAMGPVGGFLPAGSGWLPVIDDDFVTYRLTVRIVSPQVAVATGRLSAERTAGGTYEATFESSFPKEPPSLFTGPFHISEREHDDVRLRTYFADDIRDYADLYLTRTAKYLDHLMARIGPYPYDGFAVVAGPLPVGLGFPGLTYIGQRIVPLPFMQSRSLAHEIAHSWWGNAVAVDYDSGNWAEGLTTYMADYGLAVDSGPDAARDMRLGWLRDYAALPTERDTPVIGFVSKSHDASQIIGYNKAAFVLHMLHQRIGNTAFVAGIRRFWSMNRGGIAGWRDLKDAFETASGEELDLFFDQWLTRAGAPRVEIADASVIDSMTVRVTLRQSTPTYVLDLPVVVETVNGSERNSLRMDQAEQVFNITVGAAPVRFSVDPEFDVFRRLLPGESAPILRDVTLAVNPVVIDLSGDDAYLSAATSLTLALFRGRTVLSRPRAAAPPNQPFVLMGTTSDITAALRAWTMASPPENVSRGRGAAWMVRTLEGHAGLIVRADDAAALSGMIRSLPHYGRRGFVVFGPDGVIDRGAWAVTDGPMSRALTR